MSCVLIIGAKSDIAKALARIYAKHGHDLHLAARNVEELNDFANDIRTRTQRKVVLNELDILNFNDHHAFYDELEEKPQGIIAVVGYLGDQEKAQTDFLETKQILDTNYTGVVSLINLAANDFESKKSGFIVGISSVAGERGRKSNYIYGSAKAGLTAYLSGLRNRLHPNHIQVLTVKPGFVRTKMTAGMDLPERLTLNPRDVARDIFWAQQKGKDIIYSKWLWRYIMFVIRMIPERIFKGMSL